MTQHVSQRKTRGIVAVRADGSSDVTKLFADLNKDWEAFKATMSEKDAQVAARFDDVVTTEKLKRIEEGIGETNARYEAEIDKLNAKLAAMSVNGRSEERRVGKEWRSRWSPYH